MTRPFWLITALCFALVGCSAKAPKDSFKIIISTNPPGANVTVCNERTELCASDVKTPFTMVLARSTDLTWPTRYTVLCKKEGYVEVARTLYFGVDGWYLLIEDKATSEMVEVWEVNGYRIELELPLSQAIEMSPGDSLTMMNMAR